VSNDIAKPAKESHSVTASAIYVRALQVPHFKNAVCGLLAEAGDEAKQLGPRSALLAFLRRRRRHAMTWHFWQGAPRTALPPPTIYLRYALNSANGGSMLNLRPKAPDSAATVSDQCHAMPRSAEGGVTAGPVHNPRGSPTADCWRLLHDPGSRQFGVYFSEFSKQFIDSGGVTSLALLLRLEKSVVGRKKTCSGNPRDVKQRGGIV